jgi:hypothetical protein
VHHPNGTLRSVRRKWADLRVAHHCLMRRVKREQTNPPPLKKVWRKMFGSNSMHSCRKPETLVIVRLSIQHAYSKLVVTPDAIEGSSEALLVIVKCAALEERIAHRLAEAIDLAAREGHRLMPAITLNVTLCL